MTTPTPSEARQVALLEAANAAINELEYAAYNYDGSRPDDLPAGITESTSVSASALIAARDLRNAVRALRQGGEAVAWRYVYEIGGEQQCDLSHARFSEAWIAAANATETPLYALPPPPAEGKDSMTTNQETSLRERLLSMAACITPGGLNDAEIALLREAAEALSARAEAGAVDVAEIRNVAGELRDWRGSQGQPSHRLLSLAERLDDAIAAPSPASRARPEAQAGEYLCGGMRFKLHARGYRAAFTDFPAELAGKWVALVDATDNRHMLAAAPSPASRARPEAQGAADQYECRVILRDGFGEWHKCSREQYDHIRLTGFYNGPGGAQCEARALYATPPADPAPEARGYPEYVIALLVAGGYVTQAKVDEARAIALGMSEAKTLPPADHAPGGEVTDDPVEERFMDSLLDWLWKEGHGDESPQYQAAIALMLDRRQHIAALEAQASAPGGEVTDAAYRWWLSRRPLAFNEAEHLANPGINTCSDAEKALAKAVAAALAARTGKP